jgi:hypothetical protein
LGLGKLMTSDFWDYAPTFGTVIPTQEESPPTSKAMTVDFEMTCNTIMDEYRE